MQEPKAEDKILEILKLPVNMVSLIASFALMPLLFLGIPFVIFYLLVKYVSQGNVYLTVIALIVLTFFYIIYSEKRKK